MICVCFPGARTIFHFVSQMLPVTCNCFSSFSSSFDNIVDRHRRRRRHRINSGDYRIKNETRGFLLPSTNIFSSFFSFSFLSPFFNTIFPSSSHHRRRRAIVASDMQINLRLILVSGKTKEFLFNQTDSAGDIALTVFENWPDGKFQLPHLPAAIRIDICTHPPRASSENPGRRDCAPDSRINKTEVSAQKNTNPYDLTARPRGPAGRFAVLRTAAGREQIVKMLQNPNARTKQECFTRTINCSANGRGPPQSSPPTEGRQRNGFSCWSRNTPGHTDPLQALDWKATKWGQNRAAQNGVLKTTEP